MIVGFADRTTRDIFDATDSKDARAIPKQVWPVARRKLDMLNAAQALTDLKAPPSNKLEKLRDDRAGFWAIRINDQYRVTFRFDKGTASEVRITDYH